MQKSIDQMAVGDVVGQLPVGIPCFPTKPLTICEEYQLLDHVAIHEAHSDNIITEHFRKFDKQYGPYQDRNLVISEIAKGPDCILIQTVYSVAGLRLGVAVFRITVSLKKESVSCPTG